jgi:hypothetical protein
MIDPKQAEEVRKIFNRIRELVTLADLIIFGGIGMTLGYAVFILGLNNNVYVLTLVGFSALLMIMVVFGVLSKPLFKISTYGQYETDKSLEDCWEETKTMEPYTLSTMGDVRAIERKDDELSFEIVYHPFMSRIIKRTLRCTRSEDKYLESMKIDIYVDNKHAGQDKIKIKSINNKTIVEYDTTYTSQKSLSEYFAIKLIGHYNPQIMRAQGYTQIGYKIMRSSFTQ